MESAIVLMAGKKSRAKMKLFLHVGTAKTGTTSIQENLFRNRSSLESAGIIYPTIGNDKNHHRLTISVNDKIPRQFHKLGEDAKRVGDEAWSAVEKYVGERDGEYVILSSEYLIDRISIPKLRARLEQHTPQVSEIEIICYLRSPASHYLSLAQQAIKASSKVPFPRERGYGRTLKAYEALGTVNGRCCRTRG